MKKIYLLLLPVLFLWGSCSMDDVLESNGELNLTVIETNNPIKAEPGETVVFQFVASTSKGELSRIEITSEDGIRLSWKTLLLLWWMKIKHYPWIVKAIFPGRYLPYW